MIRNLKALGLALVAVFAMSAMTAAGAQAAQFHSDATNTTIKSSANNTQVFEAVTEGLAVECSKFESAGESTNKTVDAITVGINYEECVVNGGPNTATVHDNDCHYLLESETSGEPTHADVSLSCDTGALEITALGATISIPNQVISTAVHYTNEENVGADSVVVEATTGDQIDFTCSPAFICGLGGIPTAGEKAAYKGNVTVDGFETTSNPGASLTGGGETGSQVNIWHE